MVRGVLCAALGLALILLGQYGAAGQGKELREISETLKRVDQNIESIDTNLRRLTDSSAMSFFEKLLLWLTAAYVVGTFALFGVTWRQVNLARNQLGNATKQLQIASEQSRTATESLRLARDSYEHARAAAMAGTLQQLGANDRSIKSLLVQDPEIYAPLDPLVAPFGDRQRPLEERKLRAYIGLVINHVKHIFLQHKLDQLPAGYWEAADRDLDMSVLRPQFREVWEKLAQFQPQEFKDYVDAKLRRLKVEPAEGGGQG